jgi:hypothetical protein
LDNTIIDLADIPIYTYGGQTIKFENNIYYWGGYIMTDEQCINSKKGFKYNYLLFKNRYSIRENVWD